MAQIPPVRPKLTKNEKDSLKIEIRRMLAADQKYRWMLMFGELDALRLAELRKMDDAAQFKRIKDVMKNRAGISIAQKDSLGILQDAIDSVNFLEITAIIKKYGFPHGYIPAYEATTFLIHARPDQLTKEYFDMLLGEVNAGNLPAEEYGRIYDRNQINQKLPPLYFIDDMGEYAPGKDSNLDATNKARAEIGLKKYKG